MDNQTEAVQQNWYEAFKSQPNQRQIIRQAALNVAKDAAWERVGKAHSKNWYENYKSEFVPRLNNDAQERYFIKKR